MLKNFKVVIFDTLKDGKIKEYLYVHYVFRFTFLNVLSLAFLIKELYSLCLSGSEKEKIFEDKLIKKMKSKPRASILLHSYDKQPKFDKAMIMYTHAFNSTKNKAAENKEQKEERYQTAFLGDLSTFCNLKDVSYKNMYIHFNECFKKLDEG